MVMFGDARVGSDDQNLYRDITIGEVVDTNDPQQMGRIRVLCNGMGDNSDALLADIPWATAMTPLGGITETTERGRDGQTTEGPVAYGMWNIPKVGSHVLIACIDGDMRFRVWLGCLHPQFMTHTLPHGRYVSEGKPSVVGPLSSSEGLIQPTGSHQQKTFTPSTPSVIVPGAPVPGGDYTTSPEYISRGADFSGSGVRDELASDPVSDPVAVGDDNFEDVITEIDGTQTNRANGYKESRVVKNLGFAATDGKNYDPQVYSWTTPGFHGISMDDSANNCRIRFRTTHGNQIILDDTNERIYLSTPDGKTWIEMDEKGNIDVYANRNISFNADNDINLTAGNTVRVKARNGIHVESDDEIRIHSKGRDGGDFHIRAETNIRQHSVLSTFVESDLMVHVKSLDAIMIQTGTILNITAASKVRVSSPLVTMDNNLQVVTSIETGLLKTPEAHISTPDSTGHPNADGQLDITPGVTAPLVDNASIAEPAAEFQAFFTSRVPEHEPWARVMTNPSMTDMDIDNTHEGAAEFPYNSPMVNKVERGFDLSRNDNWHR